MKLRFNYGFWLLFLMTFVPTFAQKFDKKYSEKFNVNSDVEIQINASNTEINVSTGTDNEVHIEAYIQVEGVTKEEAEKYFKNWKFEALGNKTIVKINANSNYASYPFKNDFVFFNPETIKIPKIKIEDIDIKIPDMDFKFDFDDIKIFENFEDFDWKEGEDNELSFILKNNKKTIKIKSKEDWEKFKKSKDYKEFKAQFEVDRAKMKEELAKSREELKKALKENRLKIEIDREKIQRDLAKAKEELAKLNLNFEDENVDLNINGKKVKVTKQINIKVPKNATFNLNTRHCKVTLPKTVAYGNVKYGSFNANSLTGGDLKIYYSPVTISDVNACTLFLNNVTDAKIASVTNTNVTSNYGALHINQILKDVKINSSFGDLQIAEITKNHGLVQVFLKHSNAVINLKSVQDKLIDLPKSTINATSFYKTNKAKTIVVNGSYSTLTVNQ